MKHEKGNPFVLCDSLRSCFVKFNLDKISWYCTSLVHILAHWQTNFLSRKLTRVQLSFMVVWFNCYLNDSTFARNLQWKTTKHIFTIDLSTFNRFVLTMIGSRLPDFNSNIFQLNFVNVFSLASKKKNILFRIYFAHFVCIWIEAENRIWFKTELSPQDSKS